MNILPPQKIMLLSSLLLSALLIPPIVVADLFLGVSPGDSCRNVHAMEIARGAKPGLPLEEMLRQGMLGFERARGQTREINLYRCNEGTVVSVSHAVAFDTQEAQKHYFGRQREALEQRFGEPELDTFNLTVWEKLLLWFEGMNKTIERFQTVYWTLGQGHSAQLSLSERPNQRRKYLVVMDLNTESTVSSGPRPEIEQAPD